MCSKCCNTYLLVEKENKPHMSECEAAEDRARIVTAENSSKCVEAKMLNFHVVKRILFVSGFRSSAYAQGNQTSWQIS